MKSRTAGLYALYIVLVAFAMFPIVMCFIGSIMPESELRSLPSQTDWFKYGPTFVYYKYVFLSPFGYTFPDDPYLRWTLRAMVILNISYFFRIALNSFIVALAVCALNLVLGTIAAYPFARGTFRGNTLMFIFILLSRLLPPVAIAVPYYTICLALGLTNSLWSVVIVHCVLTLPFTIWYLTLYYRSIPVDIEEAALVCGASPLGSLLRITIPLASSGLVAIGLFSFLLSYNEFLFSQFLLEKIEVQTIPLFLGFLSTSTDIMWGLQYSIIFLSIVPVIAFIAVIWKFLNLSELAGALKK